MPTRRKVAPKPAVTKVAIRSISVPYVDRIGFIPAGLSHTSQFGETIKTDSVDRWVYEDAQDEDSYLDPCLKTLLQDCVPDAVQTNELLLILADIYREAKGLK